MKKRKSDINNIEYKKSLSDDEQRNPNLKVVDTYENSVKRKRDENGSDFEILDSNHQTNKKRKNDDDEKDPGLRIIDSYDRIENKI